MLMAEKYSDKKTCGWASRPAVMSTSLPDVAVTAQVPVPIPMTPAMITVTHSAKMLLALI